MRMQLIGGGSPILLGSKPFWVFDGSDWVEALGQVGLIAGLAGFAVLLLAGLGIKLAKKGATDPAGRSTSPVLRLGALVVLVLFMGGFGLAMVSLLIDSLLYPHRGIYYVVNGSPDPCPISINGEDRVVPGKNWTTVRVRGNLSGCEIKWSDEGQTQAESCPPGVHMMNLSDDWKVTRKEVEYTQGLSFNMKPDFIPTPHGKGLWPVSENVKADIFDFATGPPSKISVKKGEENKPRFNLELIRH